MSRLSLAFSHPVARLAPAGQRVSARIAGGACVLAAAAIAVGSCTTSPQPKPAGAPAGSGHGAGSLSAAKAVALATRDAKRITSMTLKGSIAVRGLPTAGAAGHALTMIVRGRMRLKPTLLAAISLNMNLPGRSIAIDEILTTRAMYLKAPGVMPGQPGKPWAKISLSSLPNGMTLRKLFAQTQKNGPLGQLGSPRALTRLLSAVRHLRVVRDQVVDGVSTTEYSGMLALRHMFALMPASERRLLGPAPAGLRGSGPFRVWIDGQHHVRRMELKFTFRQISMAVRFDVTSINKPLRIGPPPASQVSAISSP